MDINTFNSNQGRRLPRWMMALTDPVWLFMALNLAVFIAIYVAMFCGVTVDTLLYVFTLPASFHQFLTRPWTLLTYMFTQWDFWQLTFNMLWLWSFGSIAQHSGISSRLISAAYLGGGAVAGIMFIVIGAMGRCHGILVGSSAAVLSVVAMTGYLMRNVRIGMMFIGNIRTWLLAAIVIALVLATGVSSDNFGPLTAHISGAATGLCIGLAVHASARRRTTGRTVRQPSQHRGSSYGPVPKRGLTPAEQAELDELLREVRKKGYACISREARQRLFELSSKIK